jgi:uncharacterized protein
MVSKIFINLPVKDLKMSIDFFTKLGFSFNPKFTDDKAACLVISDTIYAMLLTRKFFKSFTNKTIPNPSTHTEAIFALEVDSKAKVNDFAEKALKAGGSEALEASDYGFMFGRSFYDLDGHMWEVFWMDESRTTQTNT